MSQAIDRPPEYVCGFLFNDDLDLVALVKKNRPAWQAGKYNGVGGKIEITADNITGQRWEYPIEAMSREFKEETGVSTFGMEWTLFRSETFKNGTGATVHFLYAHNTNKLGNVDSVTDEPIHIVGVHELRARPQDFMYNLPYLIEMALCYIRQPKENIPAP